MHAGGWIGAGSAAVAAAIAELNLVFGIWAKEESSYSMESKKLIQLKNLKKAIKTQKMTNRDVLFRR